MPPMTRGVLGGLFQRRYGTSAQLGLVDWEHSGVRDPAADLANLLTHANQEDLLHWDE